LSDINLCIYKYLKNRQSFCIIVLIYLEHPYMEDFGQDKEKLASENERLRKRISDLESENAALKAAPADPEDKWAMLGESEQTYKTIFENTGAATCIVDKDGTILLANSRFAYYTGKTVEEIENRLKWMEFIHEEDLAEMMKQHQLRRTQPDEWHPGFPGAAA